jgi:hypothetical protein
MIDYKFVKSKITPAMPEEPTIENVISWYQKEPITELTLNRIRADINGILSAKYEKQDPYYGGPALLLLRQLEDECLSKAGWLR